MLPAAWPRQAASAAGEVKASTWVRPPVTQVPQPAPVAPGTGGAATGSSRSARESTRK